MKRLMCGAALVLALGFGVSDATARSLSAIVADTGLSPEDFTMLEQSGATLYQGATPQKGAKANWSNAKSGSTGVVEITEVSGNCVRLAHVTTIGSTGQTVRLDTHRCKSANGDWLLMPD